ncbi:unnamed protein product [Moneuplotes crassus]|uniref:Uncharacterized protein n=1 Tax=Euplotes crassus TaxID=5936 RepID=A0AAD1XTZ2_EUPCR|nr:unnamed protein product [Moneuplotes crassus]
MNFKGIWHLSPLKSTPTKNSFYHLNPSKNKAVDVVEEVREIISNFLGERAEEEKERGLAVETGLTELGERFESLEQKFTKLERKLEEKIDSNFDGLKLMLSSLLPASAEEPQKSKDCILGTAEEQNKSPCKDSPTESTRDLEEAKDDKDPETLTQDPLLEHQNSEDHPDASSSITPKTSDPSPKGDNLRD